MSAIAPPVRPGNGTRRFTSSRAKALLALLAVLLSASCGHLAGGGGAISEITLERTGCDTCEAYSAVLRRDGTVEVHGNEKSGKPGRWRGYLEPALFDELAEFVIREGYLELEREYGQPWFHVGPTHVAVVRNGARRTVTRYPTAVTGAAVPLRLEWIEAAIDTTIARAADWEKVSDEPYGAAKPPQ